MAASVLLDTSFLISLVDRNRPNHSTASQDGEFSVQAVVMAEGFDDCAFRDDGQRGFGFTVMPEPDN